MSALDRFNDLSALGLVLFLTQQASIPKFLELPEPDGRVASGFRSRGGRSTSQGIELHDLFLRLANRVIAVQWDSMDGAIGKGDRRVGLSLRGQSGKPDRHEHRTTGRCSGPVQHARRFESCWGRQNRTRKLIAFIWRY